MKHLAQLTTAAFIASAPLVAPVFAQESEIEEGMSLIEQGALLFFRGVMSEMEPAIEDFKGIADELAPALRLVFEDMGPALIELMQQIDDIEYYQTPEILPNGDIILRRREDAPDYAPPDADEIDL